MDNQHPIDNFIINNIVSKMAPLVFNLRLSPNNITIFF